MKEQIGGNEVDFKGLGAEAIWQKAYGQPLVTKKSILEYIDKIKELSKQELEEEQLQQSYDFINEYIMKMSPRVKANTLVYLKKELQMKLGKFNQVKEKNENHFLNFFKETYPENKRTKEYTFVLADRSRISDIQVLETLKTINTFCLRNTLTKDQKEDIFPLIERLVDTQSLRFINQLRSMEGIRKSFKIRIIEAHEMFHIKKIK